MASPTVGGTDHRPRIPGQPGERVEAALSAIGTFLAGLAAALIWRRFGPHPRV